MLARRYLWLGMLASILVGIGEYLLHYSEGGPAGEIKMLENIPLDRASAGHFISVISAPLYFVGYYGIFLLFRNNQPTLARILFVLGCLAFFFGSIWIASRYYAALVLQTSSGTDSYQLFYDAYDSHYQVLVWLLRVVILLLSLTYMLIVIRERKNINVWWILLTPILLLATIISSILWLPIVGNHLAPIAMNATHFIFFGGLLIISKYSISN